MNLFTRKPFIVLLLLAALLLFSPITPTFAQEYVGTEEAPVATQEVVVEEAPVQLIPAETVAEIVSDTVIAVNAGRDNLHSLIVVVLAVVLAIAVVKAADAIPSWAAPMFFTGTYTVGKGLKSLTQGLVTQAKQDDVAWNDDLAILADRITGDQLQQIVDKAKQRGITLTTQTQTETLTIPAGGQADNAAAASALYNSIAQNS